jgi:hypothetical protein
MKREFRIVGARFIAPDSDWRISRESAKGAKKDSEFVGAGFNPARRPTLRTDQLQADAGIQVRTVFDARGFVAKR